MPPRILTLSIVAFWLATTGWLYYRDIGPQLTLSGPPPFVIDLTDEAQQNIPVRWSIYQNNEPKPKGYCTTFVSYEGGDDTFLLQGVLKLWREGQKDQPEPDTLIESSYRVTREGVLRGIVGKLQAKFPAGLIVDGEIVGEVRRGIFKPTFIIRRPIEYQQELKPIKVHQGGSILNPLQPLQRLTGLTKGQRWEITLVDPLTDLAHKYVKELTGASPAAEVRVLRAHVLPETQVIRWGNREEATCLLIEYEGEDTSARTWVRERDGLVLKQELTQGTERFVLVRD